MKRIFLAFILSVMLLPQVVSAERYQKLPANGVIPDERTAVAVSEILLVNVFGEEVVSKYRPYHARLQEGVWVVYGTLPYARGGTPQLKIRKQDAKVLIIWHSQ